MLTLYKPSHKNIWLCRADSGKYFNHFKKYGVIALGHFQSIKNENFLNQENVRDFLRDHLTRRFSMTKSSATNRASQAMSFISEAEIGDLVISVNSKNILIGRIESDFEIDSKQLWIRYKSGKSVSLDFNFRRKVTWAGSIPRYKLPSRLAKGILGQQTFYSLNGYKAEVYSLIAPFVQIDDSVTATFRIEKKEKISTYHYQVLTRQALQSEYIADEIDELSNQKSCQNLINEYRSYSKNSTSTIKAEFSSPGFTSFTFANSENIKLLLQVLAGALLHNDPAKFISTQDSNTIRNIEQLTNNQDDGLNDAIDLKPAGEEIDIEKLANSPDEIIRIEEARRRLRNLPRE